MGAVLQDVSLLNWLGAGLYLFVAMMCGAAWRVSVRQGMSVPHGRAWFLIALFFCLLIASRLLGLEDMLRDVMRDLLRSQGAYEGRTYWQLPAVIALFAIAVCALGLIARQGLHATPAAVSSGANRMLMTAQLAAFAMLLLVGLRTISLHSVDAMLYSGPIRLNWILDIGASLLVAGCAVRFAVIVAGKQSGRR